VSTGLLSHPDAAAAGAALQRQLHYPQHERRQRHSWREQQRRDDVWQTVWLSSEAKQAARSARWSARIVVRVPIVRFDPLELPRVGFCGWESCGAGADAWSARTQVFALLELRPEQFRKVSNAGLSTICP